MVSAKAEYACLAMLELAARHGDPRPVRLAELADRHGISRHFLVQILAQLKGAGLVATTRGAAGGYHLGRAPATISLADVLAVADPGERPTPRPDAAPLAAALFEVWDRLHAEREQRLRATDLATLVEAGRGLEYVI